MISTRSATLVLLLAVNTPIVHVAQQAQPAPPPPTFDAATVRVNNSGEPGVYFTYMAGRFDAKHATLRTLIRTAFNVQDAQIVDAPDWVGAEHFDVFGRGEVDGSGPPTAFHAGGPSRLQLMMQALLADRFRLAAHTETRQSLVYVLMVARSDRGLGSGLRQSDVDCAALAVQARKTGAPAQMPKRCELSRDDGAISIGGRPLAQLALTLSNILGRTVVDRTGLTGMFDVSFRWASPSPNRPSVPPAATPARVDESAVIAAVHEQLGLDLLLDQTSTEVLVIDHVERLPDR